MHIETKTHSCSTRRIQSALRVTYVGIGVNLLLSGTKLAAGILGSSHALVADAVHSLSDLVGDLVIVTGFLISSKPVDSNHHYGHGKFETLATTIIGILLFLVSFGLLISGSRSIYEIVLGNEASKPSIIALVAALVSIFAKESMFHYTRFNAKKLKSPSLEANAWHQRSDALTSVAAFIGVGGAIIFGDRWLILDPLAGIVVSFFIAKVAYGITKKSLSELTECSLTKEEEENIVKAINSVEGAMEPHSLRTRKIGSNIAIDVHILVKPSLNIVEAHDISSDVEKKLKQRYGEETFISVHIEPLLTK